MVRSATEIWVYWQATPPPVTLRLRDVSGFPQAAVLDGCGLRDVAIRAGATDLSLHGLMPGHLYLLQMGTGQGDDFKPTLSAGPVLTGGGAP